MSSFKKITLKVDAEVLDIYIEHANMYKFYMSKTNESETYRKKAKEHFDKMMQLQLFQGLEVLLTLERLTGKSIPVEL